MSVAASSLVERRAVKDGSGGRRQSEHQIAGEYLEPHPTAHARILHSFSRISLAHAHAHAAP